MSFSVERRNLRRYRLLQFSRSDLKRATACSRQETERGDATGLSHRGTVAAIAFSHRLHAPSWDGWRASIVNDSLDREEK